MAVSRAWSSRLAGTTTVQTKSIDTAPRPKQRTHSDLTLVIGAWPLGAGTDKAPGVPWCGNAEPEVRWTGRERSVYIQPRRRSYAYLRDPGIYELASNGSRVRHSP